MYISKKKNKYVVLIALVFNISCATYTGDAPVTKNVHIYSSVDMSQRMAGMSEELLIITGMTSEPSLTTKEHNELLERLQALSLRARSIGGDNTITNYSVINQYMGAFIYDVELAKEFANKNPPNYVPANRLVKSCIACHDS